jgi:hypothetical protein
MGYEQGGLGNTLGGLGFMYPGTMVERESTVWTILHPIQHPLPPALRVRVRSHPNEKQRRERDDVPLADMTCFYAGEDAGTPIMCLFCASRQSRLNGRTKGGVGGAGIEAGCNVVYGFGHSDTHDDSFAALMLKG